MQRDLSATACMGCGYSLVGLQDQSTCPECGLATLLSHERARSFSVLGAQSSALPLLRIVSALSFVTAALVGITWLIHLSQPMPVEAFVRSTAGALLCQAILVCSLLIRLAWIAINRELAEYDVLEHFSPVLAFAICRAVWGIAVIVAIYTPLASFWLVLFLSGMVFSAPGIYLEFVMCQRMQSRAEVRAALPWSVAAAIAGIALWLGAGCWIPITISLSFALDGIAIYVLVRRLSGVLNRQPVSK